MIAGAIDWLLQSLLMGVGNGAVGRALLPLGARGPAENDPQPLRVVAMTKVLVRPLRAAGHEVLGPEALTGGQVPDAVCAVIGKEELGARLSDWAQAVRPGGMVVLLTRRGKVPRPRLCAAMLHAGLGEVTQAGAGATLVTAGRAARHIRMSVAI